MNNLHKITWTHKVQYYETDQMKVVHHSNYIRWFEEARVELMEKIGCPYDKMEEKGIISPVLEVTCQYKQMVRFGDTVEILAWISTFNGIRFSLSYEVHNAKDGSLCTTGTSRHCFLNAQGSLISLKREGPALFESLKKLCEE